MKNKSKTMRHWMVLIVCCGLTASSIGLCVNVVGVFYTPVSESLGILRGTFAMQSTLTMSGTAVGALFAPRVIDKWGIKRAIGSGALLAALSTILMAFANQIPVFYVLGIIRGLGSSLFSFVPVTMIINQWFHQKHGFATSIVLSFSGITGAVFSPVLTFCIDTFGWRNAYIVMGIIIFVFCIPAFICRFTFDPREDGYLPYGFQEEEVVLHKADLRRPLFNYRQWTFIALLVLSILVTLIAQITQHFPGFAEAIGHGSQVGAVMLSAGMMGNIFSKLIMGSLCDRLGAVKVVIGLITVNMFSMVLLITQSSSVLLMVAAFLFGSAYGVAAVGVTLLTRHFFGMENYGKAYPLISFGANFGGAFALSLVGYIYDFTGSYYYAFCIGLALNIVNLLLIWSAVMSQKRQLN